MLKYSNQLPQTAQYLTQMVENKCTVRRISYVPELFATRRDSYTRLQAIVFSQHCVSQEYDTLLSLLKIYYIYISTAPNLP